MPDDRGRDTPPVGPVTVEPITVEPITVERSGASDAGAADAWAGDAWAGGAPDAGRDRPVRRLKAALAVACLVAVALTTVLYLDRRGSGVEREVAEAVEAYTAAWNAHDRDAVVAAMAPGARFAAGDSLEHPLFTAYSGSELDRLLSSVFRASVSLKTTGRVTVAGKDPSHATVTQRYRYEVHGLWVVEDGVSLYTLARVDGTLKVLEHMWWRPRGALGPSMLWAT